MPSRGTPTLSRGWQRDARPPRNNSQCCRGPSLLTSTLNRPSTVYSSLISFSSLFLLSLSLFILLQMILVVVISPFSSIGASRDSRSSGSHNGGNCCSYYSTIKSSSSFLAVFAEAHFLEHALANLAARVKEIDSLKGWNPNKVKANDLQYLDNPDERARRTLAICMMVPRGCVTTYGAISRILVASEEADRVAGVGPESRGVELRGPRIGTSHTPITQKMAGPVAGYLGLNPFYPIVPNHRVVSYRNRIEGIGLARGNTAMYKHIKVLREEGVHVLVKRKGTEKELGYAVVDSLDQVLDK